MTCINVQPAFALQLRASLFLGRSIHSATHRYKPAVRIIPRHQRSSKRYSSTIVSGTGKLGFIGLGVMGLPMAANLANKNISDLIVWNRSPERFEYLSKSLQPGSSSVAFAASPLDVIEQCDVTFSMLSTPEAVGQVFHAGESPLLNSVTQGKSLVDCSTLTVDDMKRTAACVRKAGGAFLEAPVSGSKVPAEKGQLLFLCGGDKSLFENVSSALDAMGKRSFYLGEVGNGTKMKLIVNQIMSTMLAALAEGIALSEALNISVNDLLEVLNEGAIGNSMFAIKGPGMKSDRRHYPVNFPLEHAQKDMRFAQMLGDELGISLSVSSAANEWYKAAKGMGLSRDDFSAVIESVRAAAGR